METNDNLNRNQSSTIAPTTSGIALSPPAAPSNQQTNLVAQPNFQQQPFRTAAIARFPTGRDSTDTVATASSHSDDGDPERIIDRTTVTATTASTTPASSHPRRIIIIPQRSCQGGLDFKFDPDPNALCRAEQDLVQQWFDSSDDYRQAIKNLNNTLKPARAGKVDAALLIAGPLLVPLGMWALRHAHQQRRRRRLLQKGMLEFQALYAPLYMKYIKVPGRESYLSIQVMATNQGIAHNPPRVGHLLT